MTSTYTSNQGIEKPATGDQSGTWGGTVNTNMDIIDRDISGVGALTLTGSTTTLTTTDGSLTDGMYRVLVLGDEGDLGSDNTITISPNDQDKAYLIYNNLSADRNAIFTQGTGANATVQNGETAWIYADGGGSGAIVRTAVSSVKITDQDGDTQIQVEEGGDDDDTIRFDIAGAEDFTMSANSLNVLTGSVLALPDAAVATPALTNTGDLNTGLYFPAADTLGVTTGGTEQFRFGSNPIPGGEKNLVQNGSMAVAQRATQTGLGASTAYTQVDRFKLFCSGTAGRVTADQAAASSDTGQGSALKVDVTTADASVASGDIMTIKHIIEAQNCQRLRWGDSTAQDVTVSFFMASPKTGTHCISLYQSDTGRGYIKEFTIASSNTWEHFKITFPGDTGGAGINNDNGAGLNIDWPLICGTSEQGSADSWLASGKIATSNQQNLLDNTSNDIYLTAVQVEVGSIGTDFAHEGIGTTLATCQRYYIHCGVGMAGLGADTAKCALGLVYPVTMRAAPTASVTDQVIHVTDGISGLGSASATIDWSQISKTGFFGRFTGWSGGNALTQFRPYLVYNYDLPFLALTAEL